METIFFNPSQELVRGEKPIIASIAGTECGQYSAGPLTLQQSLAHAGAQLVVIKWYNAYADLQKLKPDGILLPGGSFANDSPRAFAYLEAIRYTKEHRLPIFGICAGMQLMALSEGAKIEVLSNPEEIHRQPGKHDAHRIYVATNSTLSRCGYRDHDRVNSRHREVIISRTLKYTIRQIAWHRSSEDDVVEALEFDWSDFALGVQWHPEDIACINYRKTLEKVCCQNMAEQSQALFQAFVAAATRYRGRSNLS